MDGGASNTSRWRLHVRGIVQGVGFRPQVARLARRFSLTGHVCNTGGGATIEVEGTSSALHAFRTALQVDPVLGPGLHETRRDVTAPRDETEFGILPSELGDHRDAWISPDLATCRECLAEVLDPASRRHGYAFTTCTRCGPRYSIVRALPFDRAHTSMAAFALCEDCRREHDDPCDRRYHAQTLACPTCGPRLTWHQTPNGSSATGTLALQQAVARLHAGDIVAVLGIGGFQLICRADRDAVVRRLRARKRRPDKAFALLVASLDEAEHLCVLRAEEARLLQSPQAPIVLLQRRHAADGIASSVAPRFGLLGVMLPTTPLHHLLARSLRVPLVCTSGNRSDEPLCTTLDEAARRLRGVADGFLTHDRAIVRPLDDSVARVIDGRARVLRAARGFAPITMDRGEGESDQTGRPSLLAVGGHMKASVALAVGRNRLLSQHLGDLDARENRAWLAGCIDDLCRLHHARPAAVAHDRHPDYASSRWARCSGLSALRVQHHHAHAVACMAEHALRGEALALCWDGSGLGDDGSLWGGELLRCSRLGYVRLAHLLPFRLPGGEQAIREPRRTGLALLHACSGDAAFEHAWTRARFSAAERRILQRMLQRGLNAPQSTAAGRLFDGVAALLGLRDTVSFEAQAALELELCALQAEAVERPDASLVQLASAHTMDWRPLVRGLLHAHHRGASIAALAARFHTGLAMLAAEAVYAHQDTPALPVLLTGGCFQNARLAEAVAEPLREGGLQVFMPERIPCNDGGLAFGQLEVALAQRTPSPPPEQRPCALRFPES